MNVSIIDSCIFCNIALKRIDAMTVDENENAIAFLDAFPLKEGHTLVITKKHYEKLQDVEPDQISDLFKLVHKILPLIEKGTGVQSSLIAIHNGKDAGQVIPHLHVHIVPRRIGDGGGPIHSMFDSSHRLSKHELDEILKRIRQ